MFGKAVSISALMVLSQVVPLVWGAPTDFHPLVLATVSAATPTDSGVIYAENGGLNEIGALPNYGYDNTDLTLQNVQQNSLQQSNDQGISDDSNDLHKKYYAYIVEHDDENQEQTSIKGTNVESPKTPRPQLLQINPEWFINNDISTISILHASAQPTTVKPTDATPQSEAKTESAPKTENTSQEQFSYRYLHEVALNQAKGVEIVYTTPDESAKTTPKSDTKNEDTQFTYEVQENQLQNGSPEESGNNQDNEYGYQIITVQSHNYGTNQNNQKQTEEKSANNEPNVSSQPLNEPHLVVDSTEKQPHNETVIAKTTPKPYLPYVKVEFHVGKHSYNWGSKPTVEPVPFFATAKINEDRSANSTKEKC